MAELALESRLPQLLTEALLILCKAQVDYGRTLEIIGSVHIKSDGEKVASFLIEESVKSENCGAGQSDSDSSSGRPGITKLEPRPLIKVEPLEEDNTSERISLNRTQSSGSGRSHKTVPVYLTSTNEHTSESNSSKKQCNEDRHKRSSMTIAHKLTNKITSPQKEDYNQEEDDISIQVIEIDDNCEIKLANTSRRKNYSPKFNNSDNGIDCMYDTDDDIDPDYNWDEEENYSENFSASNTQSYPSDANESSQKFTHIRSQVKAEFEVEEKGLFASNFDMVSESGLKRVPCPHCSVPITKYYLAEHIESVHKKDTIFLCDRCEYSTYSKAALRMHGYRNHGDGSSCSKSPKRKKMFQQFVEND